MVAYLGVILFNVRLSRRVHHACDGVRALLGARVSLMRKIPCRKAARLLAELTAYDNVMITLLY